MPNRLESFPDADDFDSGPTKQHKLLPDQRPPIEAEIKVPAQLLNEFPGKEQVDFFEAPSNNVPNPLSNFASPVAHFVKPLSDFLPQLKAPTEKLSIGATYQSSQAKSSGDAGPTTGKKSVAEEVPLGPVEPPVAGPVEPDDIPDKVGNVMISKFNVLNDFRSLTAMFSAYRH